MDPWFVANVRELPWVTNEAAGDCCVFEDDEHQFAGSRASRRIVYPRNELALSHGIGVEVETTVPAEAYADQPRWVPGVPLDL